MNYYCPKIKSPRDHKQYSFGYLKYMFVFERKYFNFPSLTSKIEHVYDLGIIPTRYIIMHVVIRITRDQ